MSAARNPKPRTWIPAGELRRLEVVDLDLLGVTAGASVLDVGCHIGRLMLRMARHGCNVVGLDVSRADLVTGQRHLNHYRSQVELVEGDGGWLPFADASFDFVTCTETLEHLASAKLALRELARVLKPGGRLAVSVPDTLPELVGYQLCEIYRADPWGHKRIYTRHRLVRDVEVAGLRVYARRLRNSVEAAYWTLLYIVDAWPLLKPWAVNALNRWRDRSNEEPYSLLYHVLDEAGNRLLPKSIVVYATKPV